MSNFAKILVSIALLTLGFFGYRLERMNREDSRMRTKEFADFLDSLVIRVPAVLRDTLSRDGSSESAYVSGEYLLWFTHKAGRYYPADSSHVRRNGFVTAPINFRSADSQNRGGCTEIENWRRARTLVIVTPWVYESQIYEVRQTVLTEFSQSGSPKITGFKTFLPGLGAREMHSSYAINVWLLELETNRITGSKEFLPQKLPDSSPEDVEEEVFEDSLKSWLEDLYSEHLKGKR